MYRSGLTLNRLFGGFLFIMMTIENIKKRKEILKVIRDFFDNKDYLEVETPLFSSDLIPESAIEIYKTEYVHPFKQNKEAYLIPSPEIWLKRFISKNPVNIYEISKCFRNSEQSGKQHNPEFTMIEYYTMDYTHQDTLNLTIDLLKYINKNITYSKLPDKFQVLTMEDAFIKYAGFSLRENYSINALHDQADKLNINWDKNDNWETAFNRIFLNKVEPNFPKDVNLFLTDFPSNIETLAKKVSGTPWAQRWELYINGIEVGNCYSEETDPEVVKNFFITEAKEKETSIVQHNINKDYHSLFIDFPDCSGGAIGIDRLIMGILGLDTIQGVILFPHHDNI